MMLVEQTTVSEDALPVGEFKDHLRLGTGFADGSVQDNVLVSYIRAALAAIESRTGKVLVARSFVWTLTRWRHASEQALPIAPVQQVSEVKLVDVNGVETVVAADQYRLAQDAHRPCLAARGTALPRIPNQGSVDITFDAGFGAGWGDIPPDLGQAVLLLAAHYYENRAALATGERPMPFGVSLLIDRYRTVRVFGEAAQ